MVGVGIDRSTNNPKSSYRIMEKKGNIDFTFHYPEIKFNEGFNLKSLYGERM